MAIVLKDRVKQTAAGPGTGTITLGAVAPGFQGFSAIGNGNVTYFAIVDPISGDWEVNYGTYTASGTTLTRNATPLSSSSAGALVNFTGTSVDVFCTYPSEKAIYEEISGNVLVDGGPITVVGSGVTSYTTFSAALGELYANINSFAQMYAQNYSNGSEASGDFVVYRNDAADDTAKFVDMGINSSNYSSASYPIFTPGSAYVFNDGAELFIGSATDDLVLFAGGVDTTDEAARFNKTTKELTTVADANIGGNLNAVGGTFTAPVTTSSSSSPTSNEFVTRTYVDTVASLGIIIHAAVRLESIGNLSATYNNGTAGVGATLTNNGAQAALVCDGVAVNLNDRILVMDQTVQSQNGVYVVTNVGSGSTNWVLTRASDADTYGTASPNKLAQGSYFYITSGNTAAGESYTCSTVGTIVFGTTAITFSQFSAAPAYTGTAPINVSGQTISLTGTVAATNGGTGVSTVTTGDLLYGSATNTWGKLSLGAAYKPLVVNGSGTSVEWNALALNQSGTVSGALPEVNGGTNQSAYTLGDTLYSSAANTLSRLSGNTTTTKKFLTQTGTGAVSAAPSWGTINGADVTGNISGSAGSVANALTLGTYLTGTSYNGSTAVTATVDATSANTASKVVARDSSGNFSAGTITATLSGNATTSTTTTNVAGGSANQIVYNTASGTTSFVTAASGTNTVLNWNGSAFSWVNGTISGVALGSNLNSLSNGSYLTWSSGTNYNGSAASTLAVDATSANTASKVVARDSSGNFSAGTITATLNGNASTATTATTATNLSGGTVNATTGTFNGGANTPLTLITSSGGPWALILSRSDLGLTSSAYNSNGNQWYFEHRPSFAGNTPLDSANYTSYAPSLTGSGASGTWSINVTGSAGSASTATTATTANALNTANSYQVSALGVNAAPGSAGTITIGSGTGGSISGLASVSSTAFIGDLTGNATTATTATTANALNTSNNYQVNSLGVNTPGSGAAGEIRATNNITAYYSSDRRFKENVRVIPDATEKVMAIGGKLFDWTDEYIADHGGEDGYFVQKSDFGVIAQDVQKVFPLAVRTRSDGSLAVDYEKLSALAFAALCELTLRIETLEAKK